MAKVDSIIKNNILSDLNVLASSGQAYTISGKIDQHMIDTLFMNRLRNLRETRKSIVVTNRLKRVIARKKNSEARS